MKYDIVFKYLFASEEKGEQIPKEKQKSPEEESIEELLSEEEYEKYPPIALEARLRRKMREKRKKKTRREEKAPLDSTMEPPDKREVIEVKLFPHQIAAQEKVEKQIKEKGKARLIIAHTMGTGKTMTATKLAEKLHDREGGKVLIVAPSSIRTHFYEHVHKFTKKTGDILTHPSQIGHHKADIHIVSYDFFRNNIDLFLDHKDKYKVLVVDEAHNTRNPQSKLTQSIRAFVDNNEGAHVLFLTGSATNNRPEELGVLLRNLLGHEFVYGENYKLFAAHFLRHARNKKIKEVRKKAPSRAHLARTYMGQLEKLPPKYEIDPHMQEYLKHVLENHIDYIGMEHLAKLPQKIDENIDVEMSPKQEEAFLEIANTTLKDLQHMKALGKTPKSPLLRKGLMVAALKARMLSNDPRVADPDLSLEEAVKHSPKIQKIIEDVKQILEEDPSNAVVIYTNFVRHGAQPISHALEQEGIDHFVFHGGLSKEERQRMVNEFKAYKKRVIILTPAGNEGVSLNNGSHLLMVDPHPNPEKQKQAETRIRRLNSLHKQVIIRRYFAVPRNKNVKKLHYAFGPDWSIMGLAFEKDWKNKTIYDLLGKTAINTSVRKAASEFYDYEASFFYEAFMGTSYIFDLVQYAHLLA